MFLQIFARKSKMGKELKLLVLEVIMGKNLKINNLLLFVIKLGSVITSLELHTKIEY